MLGHSACLTGRGPVPSCQNVARATLMVGRSVSSGPGRAGQVQSEHESAPGRSNTAVLGSDLVSTDHKLRVRRDLTIALPWSVSLGHSARGTRPGRAVRGPGPGSL